MTIEELVKKHYAPITDPEAIKNCDGAQMWNNQWWMPLSGCDTLQNLIEDLSAFKDQHLGVATKISRIYYEIASEALGSEEEARKQFNERLANEIELAKSGKRRT